MLKLNMGFTAINLEEEGNNIKLFREKEDGTWECGEHPFYMSSISKEDVLKEIQKPFKTVEFELERKLITIKRQGVKIDLRKTLTSLALLGSMYRGDI
jgi:hypothetical protein